MRFFPYGKRGWPGRRQALYFMSDLEARNFGKEKLELIFLERI